MRLYSVNSYIRTSLNWAKLRGISSMVRVNLDAMRCINPIFLAIFKENFSLMCVFHVRCWSTWMPKNLVGSTLCLLLRYCHSQSTPASGPPPHLKPHRLPLKFKSHLFQNAYPIPSNPLHSKPSQQNFASCLCLCAGHQSQNNSTPLIHHSAYE